MVVAFENSRAEGGTPKPAKWRAIPESALVASNVGISAWWTNNPISVSRETAPSMLWSSAAAVLATIGVA